MKTRCRYQVLKFLLPFMWMLAINTVAHAHEQHAHVHGKLNMDVAIDKQIISIFFESPMANFMGFEHAPRTSAERKKFTEVVTRLRNMETLVTIDPSGECKLTDVKLHSEELSLNTPSEKSETLTKSKDSHSDSTHADINSVALFTCAKPKFARYIEVNMFDQFKGINSVSVQLATEKGQFKRTLSSGNRRLTWRNK